MSAIDSVPMRFVAALNSRDAEAMVSLSADCIEFRPLSTNGARPTYEGHDGLRAWAAQAACTRTAPKARVRKAGTARDGRVTLLSDAMIDGEELARAAIVMQFGEEGKLARVHWYFTDEELLEQLGLL